MSRRWSHSHPKGKSRLFNDYLHPFWVNELSDISLPHCFHNLQETQHRFPPSQNTSSNFNHTKVETNKILGIYDELPSLAPLKTMRFGVLLLHAQQANCLVLFNLSLGHRTGMRPLHLSRFPQFHFKV